MAAGRKYRLSGIPMWMTVLAVIFSYPAFTFFVCPVNDHLLLQTRVVVCSVVSSAQVLDSTTSTFISMPCFQPQVLVQRPMNDQDLMGSVITSSDIKKKSQRENM
jgi:hypothetical protein